MKNLFLASALLIGSLSTTIAQKFNGVITSQMEYQLPESMEAQRSMLPSEMVMHVGKDFVRTEQKTMMGDQIFINDLTDSSSVILFNMLGKMIAIKMTAEDIRKGSEGKKDPVIKYVEETKNIAGFDCKKAIVTSEDENGEESVTEVYYTEEIPAKASDKIKGLKGFPLQYTINSQGMEITITATKVEKTKVSSKLKEIPEGYEEMTMDEFQSMMGGGQ